MVVTVRFLAVYRQKRELRDELQGLAQDVLFGNVVRLGVVRIQAQYAPGKHVHHVLRRGFHDDVAHERRGERAEIREDLAKSFQLRFCRQMPEQEQVSRLFEVEPSARRAFHEIADIVAAVIELPVNGDLVAVLVLAESDDFRDLRKPADDAVAVDVAEPSFHVVLFIEPGIDDVAFARHFGQFHDILGIFGKSGEEMIPKVGIMHACFPPFYGRARGNPRRN